MSDHQDWQSEPDDNQDNIPLSADDLKSDMDEIAPEQDASDVYIIEDSAEDDLIADPVVADHTATSQELEQQPIYEVPDKSNGVESDSELDLTDDGEVEERTFEDLTLAELVGQLFRSPIATIRAVMTVTRTSPTAETINTPVIPQPSGVNRSSASMSDYQMTITTPISDRVVDFFKTRLTSKQIQLMLYLLAWVFGLVGSSLLVGPGDVRRSEENALVVGAPFLWLAFFIWLGAELYGNWKSLVSWWQTSDRITKIRWVARIVPVFVWTTALLLFTDAMSAPAELALGLVQVAIGRVFLGVIIWIVIEVGVWMARYSQRRTDDASQKPIRYRTLPFWKKITLTRIALFAGAALSSGIVWLGTPNNQIPPPIIVMWFISAILWAVAFSPFDWSIFDWATNKVDAVRRVNWRANSWAIIAFVMIMILGVGFRFTQLDQLPQEMTSDHVEKILDSNRVHNGEFNIFFANNGGREPIQMYLMSAFSNLPGLGFNHFTLKLLAALQSLVTLPVLVWMGVEVAGERNRKFGLVVGLLLAAMVAVSYWHVAITRQALRIVMTPIFTALLLIYLSRAMRYNQRSDFIKTALILGFGLYAYQAIRMLPVVIVVGVAISILVRNISWRERFIYGVNLAVLVFISFMVFLPMFHYSSEDPDHFWRRTAGRLLGDDVITEQLADGTVVERNATPEEQMAAFNANVPILMTNIRNALLMFNWKGDVGWISGVPNEPAMDIYTGTFLILGLAGWGVLMIRSRDPVVWLIPVMIFIMLLPSALSIAYPLENPSHTRTSGSIPPAYLLVAFSMAVIAFRFVEALPDRTGKIFAVLFCSGMVLLANQRNATLYFEQYPPIYIESSYPYSEAGSVLRGFAESDGSYGNAFMIAYPHWWGHRAIGIAAGKPFWPNGIVSLNDVPNFMNIASLRSDEFRLDPEKDLLFFYAPDDEATSFQLKTWFPEGREQEIQSYHPDDKYMLYRVPFLGKDGFEAFIASANVDD